MKAIKKAISVAGGQKAVASHFGISLRAVGKWVAGKVPAERCPDIELLTNHAVTCEELRPDVNWAVLRNSQQ
ncbi:TPA: helix-turn-helix domain-containing protein [Pasteurella multocida]